MLEVSLSILAITLSFFTLGWTVYRDILIKPRSKATGLISSIFQNDQEYGPYVSIRILNKGPGKIIIQSIVAKEKRNWFKKTGYFTIVYDWVNPFNFSMPTEIDQYFTTTQHLKYNKDCILSKNITKLGFMDSTGRYHWIKQSEIRKMKNNYKIKFPCSDL